MGGTIGVTSTLGRGSTFWFTARFERRPAADASWPVDLFQDLRVVVIDRARVSRDMLDDQLRGFGARVTAVEDLHVAHTALGEARRDGDRYQLVIVDEQTQEADEVPLADLIARHESLRDARVVLTSAIVANGRARAELGGYVGFLAKPIRQRMVSDVITRALGMSTRRAAAPEPSRETPAPLDVTPHVLVADDNVVNQKIAARMLEKFGCRVDVVSDGQDAVQTLLAGQRYDLVLMDCQMEHMDGFEATARIRAQEPSGRRTPIVALTAAAAERDRCVKAGMDDYLIKPLTPVQLRAVIDRWCQAGRTR